MPTVVPFDRYFASLFNPQASRMLSGLRDTLVRRQKATFKPEDAIKGFEQGCNDWKKAFPAGAAYIAALDEVIGEMSTGDDKAEFDRFPSQILETCLSVIGWDPQLMIRIFQHLWNSENRTIAMIAVWMLETFASIVAQVDDALLPESVAVIHARLEARDIDFEDLTLGQQIIERFLQGKKHHGRPTPWDWETGLPLSGLFSGFRLTDVLLLQEYGKNTLRFAIVDTDGKSINGTLPLVGFDRMDRWIYAMIKEMDRNSDAASLPGSSEPLKLTGNAVASVSHLADLLNDVILLPTGDVNSFKYEQAIEALFTAMFHPSLVRPVTQARLHDGRKRVDIRYKNIAQVGFFSWLAQHYSSAFVFIECKNYRGDPANPELDQLSGRFSKKRGQFGLLVCRSFSDKSLFANRCRDTAQDGHGFIVFLDDTDLQAIVTSIHANPSARLDFDLLQSRFDDLIM